MLMLQLFLFTKKEIIAALIMYIAIQYMMIKYKAKFFYHTQTFTSILTKLL